METVVAAPRTHTAATVVSELAVSVLIPCLNESPAIAACVSGSSRALLQFGLLGEVIVIDNGSEDGSAEVAAAAGAHVVHEPRRGYGSAYLAGLAAARGRYIIMLDGDLTYDPAEIPPFVAALEAGADVVIGDRRGQIRPGAMPWHHRYVGNPALTAILNALFGTNIRDAHCGMRAGRREALERLELRSTGMEFASEMLIGAAVARLRIGQLPVTYRHRVGTSKLSTFRDGIRHLRLLLVRSPVRYWLVPGVTLIVCGAATCLVALRGAEDTPAMLAGAGAGVVGVQALAVAACLRIANLWRRAGVRR
jgi:glycosyltransferase involved in cell wall biosynthesis